MSKKSSNFAAILYFAVLCSSVSILVKMMKNIFQNSRVVLLVVLILGAFVGVYAQDKSAAKKPFTVVIDAGHGGHDPGAIGKISQEKKLNLDVTLKLGKLIEENYPEVKVVYTRKTDVFLALQERANIVNKNNADLFICIHTNSTNGTSAVGTETFVLGMDKMQSNLEVAMRENSVIRLEDDYETKYEGFDPRSIDSYIMFELMQDQYIDQSLQFATAIQERFTKDLKRYNRGVRQAGFWVLHRSACPSVLVEMGFISNPAEEQYLASEKGKNEMAKAMFDAFVGYKANIDRRNGVEPRIVKVDKPKDEVKSAAKEEKVREEKAAEKTIEKAAEKPAEEPAAAKTDAPADKPVYRIQIFTVYKELPKNDPTFKGLQDCQYTRDGNAYKYTYGEETDYNEIVKVQAEVKTKFADCFVVAYLNGKRISVKEARAIK